MPDLYDAIRELRQEQRRLDIVIKTLEQMQGLENRIPPGLSART